MALEQLALAAQMAGKPEQALCIFNECVAFYRGSGDTWHLAQALNRMGEFYLSIGDQVQARLNFLQGCQVAYDMGAAMHILDSLLGIATLQASSGKADLILEIVQHILNHPAGTQETKERARRLQTELTAQLTAPPLAEIQICTKIQPLEEFVTDLLMAQAAI